MSKAIEDMSDEELMGMANSPPRSDIVPVEEEAEGESQGQAPQEAEAESEIPQPEEGGTNEETGSEQSSDGDDDSGDTAGTEDAGSNDAPEERNPLDEDDESVTAPKPKEQPKAPEDAEKGKAKEEAKPKDDDQKPVDKDEKPTVDYKASYDKIMAPFRANGKEVQARSPEEVIQLMQLGANYTKKLQTLQPNLKMVKMLENNGLLDEGKISFLIDLSKKDPEAIKKLVADSGMDPMDIDPSEKSDYKPKNYSVSDKQMTFDSIMEDTLSDPKGQEMLVQINKEWDKESKNKLFSEPTILKVLTEHKRSGFYDQIMSEVDHQKTIGELKGVSRIDAYYHVGGIMNKNGLLKPPAAANTAPAQQEQEQPKPAKQVVATRSTPRKAVPDSGDKAKAAAPNRIAPVPAKAQDFNPLSMSDEDFEKTAKLAQRL